jgi:peroxiredoxin
VSGGLHDLPADLPVPEDDGAADHLSGLALPALTLDSTAGPIDLAVAGRGRLVLYVYPRTGMPGIPLPPGWDEIPGARGCTPESCGFRDHAAELRVLGAALLGLSAQALGEQRQFAERERIPYPIVSDPGLVLARELGLPTFAVAGMTLYKRLTLVVERGAIVHAFYPVFPPDSHAAEVIAWLRGRAREAAGP